MPGKIKVKVLAGRNLPVMDRASDTTDAFVEIKFGGVTHKTDVCRKSLNPHWNSTEWYRFEVDESELQDEPLQLRLMDHDTYSANDAIGKVVISLAPLLAREANNAKSTTAPHGGAVMSGWIPVFDTMHGIRGELNVIVKVELFSDFNKYKTSSCGVQFFHCASIPPGYRATSIHGFVEELVVNDDPEYQWIDKIRTPRASNEARQVAFIKLSNQVQRLVGLKAAELGANAVVGYQQDFDLEGEAGVVARAIGTAVSITPLPAPSQTVNIPPCTQQQLKRYLDILATDSDNVPDLNVYYQNHQEELTKLLNILNPNAPSLLDETENIEDDEKNAEMTRQSSISSYAGSVSLYQDKYASQKSLRHLSEDQSDLNRLLNRKDDYDSDSSGTIQKIKRLKKNFFTKKFSMRSRKNDKQDDQVSLKSNSSDSSRISLVDIKNEIKKFKKLKAFRKAIVNKEEDDGSGEGMASILARSVIHAHTSLARISETQDSEHSPTSTLRRTSESEPTINLQDVDHPKDVTECSDKADKSQNIPPEIHFSSLNNISTDDSKPALQRKLSESCPTSPISARNENLLKIPAEPDYFGSISSALSGESSEVYSSSEEDDESSEIRTDSERTVETTSSVVQSVLNHEVDPAIISQMNRKLSILECITPEPNTLKNKEQAKNNQSIESISNIEEVNQQASSIKPDINETPTTTKDKCVNKPSNLHIKLHNPFTHSKASKSFSAPSSPEKTGFVYRSSKRIKRQLSKISNSNMIKSLSHYSLLPKKKQDSKTLSQPSSSSDVRSKVPSETVLGSLFLSYSDLMSLDKEGVEARKHKSDDIAHSKVSMYIGSEPESRTSLSGPSSPSEYDNCNHKKHRPSLKSTGLVHTAMETILIDKVHSILIPTSPDHKSSDTKQFFDDVTEKLEKVEESRNKAAELEFKSENCSSHFDDSKSSKETRSKTVSPFREKGIRPTGLVHTAMETILLDKAQVLLPKTPEPIKLTESHFEDYYMKDKTNEPHSRSRKSSFIIDKVHSLLTPSTEPIKSFFHSEHKKENESSGLVHTAMTTMLMDKVQTVLPDTPEPIPVHTQPPLSRKDRKISKDSIKPAGLVHRAMETILIDKMQSIILDTPKPIPIHTSSFDNDDDNKSVKSETSSDAKCRDVTKKIELQPPNIVETAMKTILMDKLQNLAPGVAFIPHKELDIKEVDKTQNSFKTQDCELKSVGLVRSAMETMLVEKVQSILGDKTPGIDISQDHFDNKEAKGFSGTLLSSAETKPESIPSDEKDLIKSSVVNTAIKSTEVSQSLIAPTDTENETALRRSKSRERKLIRQDSVHSITEESHNLSNYKFKVTPVLQHFHPILSGAPLETIPSLPETSFDHTESLDVEGVEPNISVVVCDNSHGVGDFDRVEKEKERCERDRSEKDKEKDKGSPRHARHESYGGKDPAAAAQTQQNSSLNASSTPMGIHRRSSDSDLSVTPKGGSLNTSAGNVGSGGGAILRPSMNMNNLDMLEYPFLTMSEYPPGFIVHIGGTVCARSVKLVDGGGESASRAAWWAELRTELRAHSRALRCNAVIAYRETAAICEDVCILSASGTAAVINLDCDFNADVEPATGIGINGTKNTIEEVESEWCSSTHVPYSAGAPPYRAELATCNGCRRARVPTVLLATCAKPSRLISYAKAVTLTAVAARVRRAAPTAEPGARDISDQLPFLEYELHKLLLAKLRMQGANALFSLQTQISVGERCVMALASGTAVRLAALPPPTPPRIKASENDKEAIEIQKALWESFNANRIANGFDVGTSDYNTNGILPEVENEDVPALDLCADKDACVLELDEAEDVETARSLAVRRYTMPVYNSNLKPATGAPPHAFAQVWRARLALSPLGTWSAAERHVSRALDGAAYKLRRLQPCALATPRFQLELPEDEIQLVVSGTAIPLQDPNRPEHKEIAHPGGQEHGTGDADDDIFTLDEEQLVKCTQQLEVEEKPANGQMPTTVSVTTISHISGSRIVRRVCALRLLFVRETTSVRELGGLSGFLHTFTCEVLAIVRAYTAALGGNALTSFYITQLMLQDNAHKNQGQCLLSVGGDIVHITY